MDLLTLAERVEGAEGPDRDLDAEIALAGGSPSAREYVVNESYQHLVPCYTGSIDAAQTLVPENHGWSLETRDGQIDAAVWQAGYGGIAWESRSATPALALCAASLKARALSQGEQ